LENQNLEQVFEPDPSATDYSLGVAVGGHCQKARQSGAHQVAGAPGCGHTLPNGYWPPPSGQRLVTVVEGAPAPTISSINREDPGWSASPLSHLYFLHTPSIFHLLHHSSLLST